MKTKVMQSIILDFFSFSIDGIFFLVGQGREFIVLVLNYLPYTFEFVNFSPLFILKKSGSF